jgi:Kef-type K+ transport system membrane component KefB
MTIDHTSLVNFLLLVAIVIVAAKAAGWLSLRGGQPAVFGEIVCGVILGPSLVNVLGWPVFADGSFGVVLGHLANVGVIFLMFVAGLETDLSRMREVGRVALIAGTAGVFAPLALGIGLALPLGIPLAQAAFIGIVLTATSVSITVQTLIELGQLNSKEGTTLLAAAVIDDVIAIVVLSVFIAVVGAGGGLSSVGGVAIRMAAFFALAVGLGTRLMRPALARAERLPVSAPLLAFVVVVALVYSWSAEALGRVAPITGAYIAGVLVAQAGFREQIEHRLREFVYAILAPAFFISIGLQTNMRLLDTRDLPLATLIILAAVLGKILGSGGGALAGGFGPREALRVGVGMISRGEVGLIIAAIGLQLGLLTDRLFAVMVLMVVASTIVTPVLLRMVFPRVGLTEAEAVTAVMGSEAGPNDDQPIGPVG